MIAVSMTLERAARLLAQRLARLERCVEAEEEGAWPDFLATASTLATVVAQLAPERSGRLLTTSEMAERMGVSPKTLLKRARAGTIRPAVKDGRRLIRWRADQVAR